LSAALLQRLRANFFRRGVSWERIRFLPHVPSLPQALVDNGVSLYLGSWPITGARALVEAMSAGVPVLGHVNYAHEYLGGQSLLPPGAPVWRTPPEFFEIVSALKIDELRRQSTAASEHWQRVHSSGQLAKWLSGQELAPGIIPAPPPVYEPNRLRAWLTARGAEIDLSAHTQRLEKSEERSRKQAAQLEKERSRGRKLEERCARLKAELTEARRGLAGRLREWWRKQPRSSGRQTSADGD